jgi:hypothetical protein
MYGNRKQFRQETHSEGRNETSFSVDQALQSVFPLMRIGEGVFIVQ